jgi:integrase
MARPKTGSVITRERTDGLTSYSLRVPFKGGKPRIVLGTEEDGWTPARAERKLGVIMALIEAGAWEPPRPDRHSDDVLFHEFATDYIEGRRGELRSSTYKDYRWRLVCHLLPYFASHPIAEIDAQLVDRYRQEKVGERERIKALRDAHKAPLDRRGVPVRALSNESINKTLGLLAMILDVAIDHGLLETNAARGRRRRLKAVRPRRPFLEADEIQALLDAAESLDRRPTVVSVVARDVQRLREHDNLSYPRIARELGISVSHAHYLYGRATPTRPDVVLVRRAIVATLVGSGLRVTELCNLEWRDVDLERGRLNVRDAKTESGIREVRMTPWLVAELNAYRAALRRSGGKAVGDAPVFPTAKGRRRDRTNVNERIVKRAAALASETRVTDDWPPLPDGITPHALRCTYISVLLEAGAPLPYVMAQVGHDDESTTLGIYARVLRRKSRQELDAAFDALMAA